MEVVKTNSIILQTSNFTGNNNPVKPFQMPKMQHRATQIAPSNVSPAYFHPSFGTSLQPIKEAVSLAEVAPRAHSLRGEKLKEFYNNAGLPYLLRHEVWSDKKILDAISLIGKELDKLVESKTLNKKTLQEVVDKIIPDAKNKIIIKDFADLEDDLRACHVDEQSIETFLRLTALASHDENLTNLYFKFKEAKSTPLEIIKLKPNAEHELTHALRTTFQNTKFIDSYKNEHYVGIKGDEIFNKMFVLFEQHFSPKMSLEQVEITKKSLLKQLKVGSMKELYKCFDKKLNEIIKDEKQSGNLNIGSNPKCWKQFFAYLKHNAREEKEAYRSNKRYREIYKDPNKPTDAELIPLLFAEMEKFFAQKERMVVEDKIPNIS